MPSPSLASNSHADFMTIHELKIDAEHYQSVKDGEKRCELRFDDRNFKVGDHLLLRETLYTGAEMKAGKPLEYTARERTKLITHILRGPCGGLASGWVILSIG